MSEEYKDEEIVVKKAPKVPSRTWIFAAVSFGALLFSALFQRSVTLAPTGSKVSTLFIYQTVSTSLSWVFIISGAAAVFTALAHIHTKELLARFANMQKSTVKTVAKVEDKQD